MFPPPRAGEEVLPAPLGALASEDWQQRQLAAQLCLRRDDVEPNLAWAEVLVEALRYDELPIVRRFGWFAPDRPRARRQSEEVLCRIDLRRGDPVLWARQEKAWRERARARARSTSASS